MSYAPEADYDHLLKIIMVGDSGTCPRLAVWCVRGQALTAARRRGQERAPQELHGAALGGARSWAPTARAAQGEEFSKHFVSTIGVDFEIKQIMMGDKKVHLQIVRRPRGRAVRVALRAHRAPVGHSGPGAVPDNYDVILPLL
jgi:hypothetical protein